MVNVLGLESIVLISKTLMIGLVALLSDGAYWLPIGLYTNQSSKVHLNTLTLMKQESLLYFWMKLKKSLKIEIDTICHFHKITV